MTCLIYTRPFTIDIFFRSRLQWLSECILNLWVTSVIFDRLDCRAVWERNTSSFPKCGLCIVYFRRRSRILKWGGWIFSTSIREIREIKYFNIWGIRKKKERRGLRKRGVKIHPFHLPWIRACISTNGKSACLDWAGFHRGQNIRKVMGGGILIN